MTGVQFFLRRPTPVVPGHVVLVDSPWAVTAVSQGQFWPRTDLARFGDGQVRDVLSAIISNWDVPGMTQVTASFAFAVQGALKVVFPAWVT